MKMIFNAIKPFNLFFLILTTLLLTSCSDPTKNTARMINLAPSTGTLSPSFNTLFLEYRLMVSADVDTLTLTPTLVGENITVNVNDITVESETSSQVINLNDIDGEIRVDVIRESFESNYVITIVRGTSANAYLSDLKLSQGQLTPEFEANSVSPTGYSATVPYLSSSINIAATLADPSASLTINGVDQISGQVSPDISLVEGDNAIEILVTAENKLMTQTYSLNVTRRAVGDFAFSSYVKATNTDARDDFGFGVALWRNTLVVGAHEEDSGFESEQSDNSASDSGAVYVYVKGDNNLWRFKSYLKHTGSNYRYFGKKAAISDEFLAIASYDDVHIYRRDNFNNWVFAYDIESPNSDYSRFGFAMALSNSTLIVGAQREDDLTGGVYVYQLGNNRVIGPQITRVRGSNTESGDQFGASIALSGNTLVVGAPSEDSSATGVNGEQSNNSVMNSGAAYIFTFNDDTGWSQQAYIKASNSDRFGAFGGSVSLSGDTLVAGAARESSLIVASGGAYIFTRDASGTWSQSAHLKAHNPEPDTNFGFPTYISGETVVVGSYRENSNSKGIDGAGGSDGIKDDSGAAYLFTKDDAGEWVQKHFIKSPNADADDWFSGGISGYGDNLVLAARFEDSAAFFNEGGMLDNSAKDAGAAYIYHNAPFSNHNLALSVTSGGSVNDRITAINLDSGDSLTDCTANCNQLITRGQTVQLTPIIGNGSSIFVEWQGEPVCRVEPDINGAITVTILAETFCTAVFAEVDIQLTIAKNASSTADGLIQATSNNVVIATCDIGCENATSRILKLDSAVEITATAEAGAFVAGWSGDAQCQSNTTNLGTVTTVTMSSSKTCTALFSFPQKNELRVVVNAVGNSTGLVKAVNLSSSTTLEDCSTDCSTQITQGHSVQLTPVAGDELSEFLNWSGNAECATNANSAGVTTVSLDTNTYCVAEFGEIVIEDNILTISKHSDSTADGLIEGKINNVLMATCDIGCSSVDSATLVEASVVNLTATAENGAEVTSWSGDAQCQANASNDNTSTSVTMTASKSCTAQFDLIETHQLRLTVANSFDGTGSINGFNVTTQSALNSCSSDCSQQVASAQTVQLAPINSNTAEFSHWSGDAACSANVNAEGISELSLTADLLCTANFTEIVAGELTLTLSKTTDNTSLDGSMSAVVAFTDFPFIVRCDEGCTSATSATQTSGSKFDIFANPEHGFASVVEWTGDPQCAANASADKTSTWVTITTQAITCTAKFSTSL